MTPFFLKNNILTLSIVLVLSFLGGSAFLDMPQNSMPPYTVRFSNVVTTFPGASPERVELLVTDKIEQQLQQIAELDYVESESRTGISVISIKIKDEYTEMQPIYDKIKRKVEEIEQDLPTGCNVKIKDEDLSDLFGIIYSITGEGYTPAELLDIAEEVRDGLIKLPNAAKVVIVGEQVEQIFIKYDNTRFAELGLTLEMVKSALSKTNILFPGGDLKIDDQRIILEPTGNYETIEDLKKTIISTSDSTEMIYLDDVAEIYRGYKQPEESFVKINGVTGLSLGIALKSGGNIVELGKEVDERIEYYKSIYPYGLEFTRSASQDFFVETSVKSFVSNLVQSVVVVLIVMLIFLGFRTGIVVASLIPAVMVTTLLLMSSANVGLNQVSLAALIMALGMLVDNAIVMAESIMVRMENGEKAYDAAVSSANELKVPLLISSLTTSVAFLPFYIAQSTMGEIVGEIFVVITFALLSSWFFALTLIPLLSVQFIKIKKVKEEKITVFDRLNKIYQAILLFNLKRPLLLIVAIIASFTVSLYGMRFIPSVFMPDSERFLVTANFELPIGTDIKRTESVIAEIEKYISNNFLLNPERTQGVTDFTSYIGEGAPKYDLGYNAPEKTTYTAHILINTTSNEVNQVVIDKLDSYCFESFPDLSPTISRLGTGGGSSDPVAVRISGESADRLFEIVEEVKTKLRELPGSKNVSDDWGLKTKKIMVKISQERAQLAGISNQDIAISLETILKGKETGKFREGDQSIPIIMIDKSSNDLSIESLEGINVSSQSTGKNVPLSQIADLSVQWQSTKIKRRAQQKTITATSGLDTGFTAADIVKHLRPWLVERQKEWGPGYTFELGGESENSADGMGSVTKNLPMAFFIIALLLIGQFNSLKKTTIVLLTIPLGLIGVVVGLLVTQSYFGFFAFLGLISLAGIIINNAIVLLDRIQIEQDLFKRTKQDAILFATKERFRPIILTTATTICGLIPLWLGGGIMFEPLAIGILFGLLFATVITLLFVPVMYRLLYRVEYK